MKHLLLILYIMCMATVAWGDEVNEKDATSKAASFLGALRGGTTSSDAKGTSGTSGVTLVYATPEYYIFNRTDSTGFVVISAETATQEVLAYSNEGPFRIESKDKGAELFLNAYAEQIDAIRNGEAKAIDFNFSVTATDGGKLLTTANWYQDGSCFNSRYAPTYSSRSCVSGCVATAMSIIMRYHNWPSHGEGSYSYTSTTHNLSLSQDFSSTTFDWDNMPLNMSSYSTSSTQSNAVSALQKACGVSVAMDYDPQGSGAMNISVINALREYFYYDCCGWIERSYINDDDLWAKIIKKEIDNDRPVLVGGESTSGGHAFVLDGYDGNGLFHYNMGWGGQNNGYYTNDAITTSYQLKITDAVVNIRPRSMDTENEYSPFFVENVKTSSSTGTLSKSKSFFIYAYNLSFLGDSYKGYIGFALYSADGTMKALLTTSPRAVSYTCGSYYQKYYQYVSIPSSVTLKNNDRIWVVTSTDGTTWKRVINYSPYLSSRQVAEPTKSDAYDIMSYYLGKKPTGFDATKCDVNGDGKASMADANAIIDFIDEKQ